MTTTLFRTVSRCLALSALVLAMGQPAAWAGGNHSYAKRIAGVWNARVNITNCLPGNEPGPIVIASFDAMNVFGADGTYLDTNSQNPATQSGHFGYWRHIRGNKYEFAQRFFTFDAAGGATGFRIVRHNVVLDKTGLSFTSGGYAETFNMAGVLQATVCSTSSAVRFD